jgi:hypothetical protein
VNVWPGGSGGKVQKPVVELGALRTSWSWRQINLWKGIGDMQQDGRTFGHYRSVREAQRRNLLARIDLRIFLGQMGAQLG